MDNLKNRELSELITLISRADTADDAFAELVARYMPLLKSRVLRYVQQSVDVSEAMQEAQIALHSAAVTYDPDRCNGVTFGLYADICIANKLRSMLRQRARVSEKESLVDTERVTSGVDVESFIATRAMCERVMSIARTQLSEYEFEVFRLTFERYTTRDIAARLGRSAKSVDNAKHRISKNLRENKEICEILLDIK